MKKVTITTVVCAVALAFIFTLSSCEKDKGTPPLITFISSAGYIHGDTTVATGSTVKFGVNTQLGEAGDVLKTLNLSKSVDGAADVTVSTTPIPTAQQDNYSQTDSVVLGSAGHTERYTYTVTNRDGITNNVKLTVTVH